MAENKKCVIENYKIEKITIDADPKLQKLLPTVEREKISFYLKNANVSIANAIRRVVSGELKVKYLTCDIHDINTNDDFIILDELKDRINFIPINQDIPVGTVFTLNVSNTNAKKRYYIVHSNEIVSKTYTGRAFAETFRLAELNPAKYLIIPKIIVVEDYGYNISSACLTHDFEYYITDYIPVKFVNERANFITKRVKTDDVAKLIKSAKHDDLFRKKILVIPNKNYQKLMTQRQLEDVKKYDIIIENPNVPENIDADNQFLKGYQSAEYDPKDFYLSISTYGNINANKILPMIYDSLLKRLDAIKEALTNKDETNSLVSVNKDNIKTQIIIRGEDHTIGNLLAQTAYELDPNIGLINTPQLHPLNRTIVLNIIHTQAVKLILDAIEEIKKRLIILNI